MFLCVCGGGGVHMSHVDFEKRSCPLSLMKTPVASAGRPMLGLLYNTYTCIYIYKPIYNYNKCHQIMLLI